MSTAPHQTLKERIDVRRLLIESLVADLSRFVRGFDDSRQFTGPSDHAEADHATGSGRVLATINA